MKNKEIEQMRIEARQAEKEITRSQIIEDINRRRVKRLQRRANENMIKLSKMLK